MTDINIKKDNNCVYEEALKYTLKETFFESQVTLITDGIALATFSCQNVIVFSRKQFMPKKIFPGIEFINDKVGYIQLNILINETTKALNCPVKTHDCLLRYVDILLQKT